MRSPQTPLTAPPLLAPRRSDALTLTEFRDSVESAWSIHTTFCVESYPGADPAHGQCAVTSALLQDHFGGELMRGHAVGAGRAVRHYWNRIDGLDIDLTWRQFPVGTVVRDPEPTTRDVLLANRWMRERYDNLRLATTFPGPVARDGHVHRRAPRMVPGG